MDNEIKREVYKEGLIEHDVDRHGIMDHVLTCATCGYQTNVVGDMTDHRQARHPRPNRYPKHVDDSPAFEVPDHMAHAYRDGRFRPSEY